LTAVVHKAGRSQWDSNTGRSFVEPAEPFDPVDVTIDHGHLTLKFEANVLIVSGHFDSREELQALLETVHYLLPALLCLDFIDAPTVKRVTGAVGDSNYVWAFVRSGSFSFDVTSTHIQEERLVRTYERLTAVLPPNRRRVVAAVHYFQVACRLARVGQSSWEFLSEVLLNLSKCLEVLFPADSARGTIDAARGGLDRLGFSTTEIERDFVPVIALRNALDVGHPSLGIFKADDAEVVHRYCEDVESAFRDMLRRLVDAINEGTFEPAHANTDPSREALGVIRRIRASLPADSGKS
jgi:hypothetical protein